MVPVLGQVKVSLVSPESERTCQSRKQKCSKKYKGHRNQLEGASSDHIWYNMITKINTVINYKPLNKYEFMSPLINKQVSNQRKKEKASKNTINGVKYQQQGNTGEGYIQLFFYHPKGLVLLLQYLELTEGQEECLFPHSHTKKNS